MSGSKVIAKVIACVGERRFALEVSRAGGGYSVRVEGRPDDAQVSGQGPFRTVSRGAAAAEAAAWRAGAGAARGETTWDVAVGGRLVEVRLLDPLRSGSGPADAGGADGVLEIRSVMPGKVVTLLAAPGDEVLAGQGLVVVEAMKMENEITAPRAGRVVSMRVRQGEAVEAGAVLATLE